MWTKLRRDMPSQSRDDRFGFLDIPVISSSLRFRRKGAAARRPHKTPLVSFRGHLKGEVLNQARRIIRHVVEEMVIKTR